MLSAWIGSILFFGIAILYLLLAFGFPLGDFAMGGRYKRMPMQMRISCAVSVVIQLIAILVILQDGHIVTIGLPAAFVKVACYVFATYLVLNTFMNLASKSKKEKLLMTPITFVLTICFWVVAIQG